MITHLPLEAWLEEVFIMGQIAAKANFYHFQDYGNREMRKRGIENHN